jgi:sigma-E factor negative regulatory protein RseC
MMKENNICHQGTVVKCEDDSVFVQIEAVSACSACKAKSMCNLTEVQEKIIEVPHIHPNQYKPGDTVNIHMKRSMSAKALWLGYLLPFVVVIVSLFLFSHLTGSELQAGLISLMLLLPYYLLLYTFRNKLKKTFTFVIE